MLYQLRNELEKKGELSLRKVWLWLSIMSISIGHLSHSLCYLFHMINYDSFYSHQMLHIHSLSYIVELPVRHQREFGFFYPVDHRWVSENTLHLRDNPLEASLYTYFDCFLQRIPSHVVVHLCSSVCQEEHRVDALQLPGEEGSIRVKAGEDNGSVFSIIRHHLQDGEEKTGEVVGGIDKVVVKLELDVETQLGVNFLKSLLKSTVRVVLLDAPLEDLSFLRLPQQWLPALLCFPLFPIGHELGRANLRDPLLVDHSVIFRVDEVVVENDWAAISGYLCFLIKE